MVFVAGILERWYVGGVVVTSRQWYTMRTTINALEVRAASEDVAEAIYDAWHTDGICPLHAVQLDDDGPEGCDCVAAFFEDGDHTLEVGGSADPGGPDLGGRECLHCGAAIPGGASVRVCVSGGVIRLECWGCVLRKVYGVSGWPILGSSASYVRSDMRLDSAGRWVDPSGAFGYSTHMGGAWVCYTCGHSCECGEGDD